MKTRNHLVQLRSLCEENELDVLSVSESWLNSSVKNPEVEIQGYKISRLVAVYVYTNVLSSKRGC